MENKEIISKQRLATVQLAKEFLSIEVGERVKTITEYSELIKVARGTIQNSIKLLTDVGCIKLQSKGHLGTYLIKKDFQKLLNYAEIGFLIGVMPLPYSRRYEGLSTGILSTLETELNIPVNMAYMRGALNRIEMVLNGRYDFAITSKYAAREFISEQDGIEILIEFGEESFLSKHVLMTTNKDFKEIEDGMKVGIDYTSIDQTNLTKKACKGKNVEFIEVNYNQIIENLLDSSIDIAIWNGDELKYKDDRIFIREIDNSDELNTIAVLVISKQKTELKKIIKDAIDIDKVKHVQLSVINNEIIPNY